MLLIADRRAILLSWPHRTNYGTCMAQHDPGDRPLTMAPLLAQTSTRRSALRRAALVALTQLGLSTSTAAGCDPGVVPSD